MNDPFGELRERMAERKRKVTVEVDLATLEELLAAANDPSHIELGATFAFGDGSGELGHAEPAPAAGVNRK